MYTPFTGGWSCAHLLVRWALTFGMPTRHVCSAMSPKHPSAVPARTWFLVAIMSVVASAFAVAVVRWSPGTPLFVSLSQLAEGFASPGEFLWWSTIGGVFAGYPTGLAGHLIWVAGTAAFWFLAVATLIATSAHLRRSSGSST